MVRAHGDGDAALHGADCDLPVSHLDNADSDVRVHYDRLVCDGTRRRRDQSTSHAHRLFTQQSLHISGGNVPINHLSCSISY